MFILLFTYFFFSSKRTLIELYPYFAIFTADSKTGIKDDKHPIECNRFDAEKKYKIHHVHNHTV